MKKLMAKINMAIIAMMVSMPAFAANGTNDGICQLITKMQGVFKTVRVLAFLGAAFLVAGWAWGYIKGGNVDMEDAKKKGIALLVGFVLLFGIGVVLSAVMSGSFMEGTLKCQSELVNGWNGD